MPSVRGSLEPGVVCLANGTNSGIASENGQNSKANVEKYRCEPHSFFAIPFLELDSEGTGYGPLAHCRQCRAVGQASRETMIWSCEMLH
jgi:hypothetical protein